MRKLLKIECVLTGTKEDIKRIEKMFLKVTNEEEVSSFHMSEIKPLLE